ncbi:MAG: polyphenol oxidase family protein [Bacteriovoracaceae bacterium]
MSIAYSEKLNRGRFETWTTKPEIDFLHVKQVHGIDIVSIETLPCDADGILVSWDEFEKPLAIKTADCMPIVIEGETGVVFLHAGWRGLADGILQRAEIKLISPLRVLIGPSIHECCFEVSADFKKNFPNSSHFTTRNEKLFFNLQAEAKDQILKQFPNALVEIAPACTCCHNKFHSYRRNKTVDRNWNLYIKG